MAVVPVYVQAGDPAYVEGIHFEGYAETRDDVAAFTTDYGIGSLITCSEDWSLWLLGTSSGTKTWLEVDPQEDPQEENRRRVPDGLDRSDHPQDPGEPGRRRR